MKVRASKKYARRLRKLTASTDRPRRPRRLRSILEFSFCFNPCDEFPLFDAVLGVCQTHKSFSQCTESIQILLKRTKSVASAESRDRAGRASGALLLSWGHCAGRHFEPAGGTPTITAGTPSGLIREHAERSPLRIRNNWGACAGWACSLRPLIFS